MRVHYLQHAKCDEPGSIRQILKSRGHTLTSTCLYLDEPLPEINDFDWLIILGGDMGVHDEDDFPWLMREKTFIKIAIKAGKLILGICLGSQLIAHVLGARVGRNKHKEIGWFPIIPLAGIKESILADVITNQIEVFHWHKDTFDLPDGSVSIAESQACSNQGFVHGRRVVGLQFHPEITKDSAGAFFQECGEVLERGPYIQPSARILSNDQGFTQSARLMAAVLETMEKI
jgi:GMP synthase-like glutamine amidotransferase